MYHLLNFFYQALVFSTAFLAASLVSFVVLQKLTAHLGDAFIYVRVLSGFAVLIIVLRIFPKYKKALLQKPIVLVCLSISVTLILAFSYLPILNYAVSHRAVTEESLIESTEKKATETVKDESQNSGLVTESSVQSESINTDSIEGDVDADIVENEEPLLGEGNSNNLSESSFIEEVININEDVFVHQSGYVITPPPGWKLWEGISAGLHTTRNFNQPFSVSTLGYSLLLMEETVDEKNRLDVWNQGFAVGDDLINEIEMWDAVSSSFLVFTNSDVQQYNRDYSYLVSVGEDLESRNMANMPSRYCLVMLRFQKSAGGDYYVSAVSNLSSVSEKQLFYQKFDTGVSLSVLSNEESPDCDLLTDEEITENLASVTHDTSENFINSFGYTVTPLSGWRLWEGVSAAVNEARNFNLSLSPNNLREFILAHQKTTEEKNVLDRNDKGFLEGDELRQAIRDWDKTSSHILVFANYVDVNSSRNLEEIYTDTVFRNRNLDDIYEYTNLLGIMIYVMKFEEDPVLGNTATLLSGYVQPGEITLFIDEAIELIDPASNPYRYRITQ